MGGRAHTERDWGPPPNALLDHCAESGEIWSICDFDQSVANDCVDFLAGLLLPLRVQDHGKEENVERAGDGDDGDGGQHADGVGRLLLVERCLLLVFGLPEASGVAGDLACTVVKFFSDLVELSDPEDLLLLASQTRVADGRVDPFRELPEERHEVGDGTGGRDLGDEQMSIVGNGDGGVGLSVGEAGGDS